jgi:hypothetical protein
MISVKLDRETASVWVDRILLGMIVGGLVAIAGLNSVPSGRGLLPVALAGLSALLAVRILRGLLQARSSGRPWTRMLLPGLVLVETAASLLRPGPNWMWVRGAMAGILELGILGVAAWVWVSGSTDSDDLPEDRLARHLEAFFPPRAARLAAVEIVVLGSAVRFAAGGWRLGPPPDSFSYHRESNLAAILPVLPLLLPGELLLVEVLMKGAAPWVRWTVHGLDIYGLLWILGLWHTVRERPHRLSGRGLLLHMGILSRASVPLDVLRGEIPIPDFNEDRDRKPFLRGAARFGLKGTEEVLLDLNEPLYPMGFSGPGAPVTRILVGVDDAAAFRTALGFDSQGLRG